MMLYFAHNFNDRIKFREIELQLEQELGIQLLNPFYDDSSRIEEMAELDARKANDVARIKDLQEKKTFKNRFNTDNADAELIVRRDLTNLAKSDGLFTIVDKPSFGTAIEICNAVLMKKPVYFVSEIYSDHPWIKIYATKTFKNLDEFKQYIKKLYEIEERIK
jgi:nucleoside 2-deoxyribosyltransferase